MSMTGIQQLSPIIDSLQQPAITIAEATVQPFETSTGDGSSCWVLPGEYHRRWWLRFCVAATSLVSASSVSNLIHTKSSMHGKVHHLEPSAITIAGEQEYNLLTPQRWWQIGWRHILLEGNTAAAAHLGQELPKFGPGSYHAEISGKLPCAEIKQESVWPLPFVVLHLFITTKCRLFWRSDQTPLSLKRKIPRRTYQSEVLPLRYGSLPFVVLHLFITTKCRLFWRSDQTPLSLKRKIPRRTYQSEVLPLRYGSTTTILVDRLRHRLRMSATCGDCLHCRISFLRNKLQIQPVFRWSSPACIAVHPNHRLISTGHHNCCSKSRICWPRFGDDTSCWVLGGCFWSRLLCHWSRLSIRRPRQSRLSIRPCIK